MIDPIKIIEKHLKAGSQAYKILVAHSTAVKKLALLIAEKNPHLVIDKEMLANAAMLHDIGMVKTNAPGIGCFGKYPYVCHGYLGREIIENEGCPELALFCERHTGTGITREEIISYNLPLPHRDMLPLSNEEKILCYADKFFSKSGKHLTTPKKLRKIHRQFAKYGEAKQRRFDEFIGLFGIYYVYDQKYK